MKEPNYVDEVISMKAIEFLQSSLNPFFYQALQNNLKASNLYPQLIRVIGDNYSQLEDGLRRRKLMSLLLVASLELEQNIRNGKSVIEEVQRVLAS